MFCEASTRESDSDLIDGMAAKPISNSGRW